MCSMQQTKHIMYWNNTLTAASSHHSQEKISNIISISDLAPKLISKSERSTCMQTVISASQVLFSAETGSIRNILSNTSHSLSIITTKLFHYCLQNSRSRNRTYLLQIR